MSRSELRAEEYVDFLIASPRQVTATEASRCQPEDGSAHAHDAFTRLLQRLNPDAVALWEESRSQVRLTRGYLIFDDSVLDKPYARKMDLVGYVWSGKHHKVVKGIDLMTLLWTDGDRHIPCDYRVYDKSDRLTKNDHFLALLEVAKERGFQPECVLFDSWYATLKNFKAIRKFGWRWLTRFKANRCVNWNRTGTKPISELPISPHGTEVWLPGYGLVKVFLIVAQDGDKQYWVTSDLEMEELERVGLAEQSWKIEEFHRGLKQTTSIERCQMRSARAQRNHIELALRAFLRIESWCFRTGVNWLMAKWNITRDAVRNYLKNPRYSLSSA